MALPVSDQSEYFTTIAEALGRARTLRTAFDGLDVRDAHNAVLINALTNTIAVLEEFSERTAGLHESAEMERVLEYTFRRLDTAAHDFREFAYLRRTHGDPLRSQIAYGILDVAMVPAILAIYNIDVDAFLAARAH